MKVILSNNKVIAVKDDAFTLAPTDTDVSIMSWDGAEPNYGDVYNGSVFISSWEALDDAAKLSQIRPVRDKLIAETDWIVQRYADQNYRQIPTTNSLAQINNLQAYRQALRDFTSTVSLAVPSFNDIIWPTKPEFV